MIISCNKINKFYGANEVLKDVSFNIDERERAAIVGVNGAGKSTLLNILIGDLSHDEGTIAYGKGKSIGYLTQLVDMDDDETIYAVVESVFKDTILLEKEIAELEETMQMSTEVDDTLILKHTNLLEKFQSMKGYEYRSWIRGVLNGLAFLDGDYTRKIKTLSGGQKRRVSLAKLLLQNPDILFLDEPTNHLDITSIVWLETYLKNYNGTVVLVSHDRYFLDKLCNKIIEIENGVSKTFNGNYTDYSVEKEIQREIEMKHYINQQKEIKKQEEVIKVLRSFNREKSIKRAESREKLLNKMDLIDKPEPIPDSMKMTLKPHVDTGYDVLHVEDLSKSFPNKELFQNISFNIYKEDIIALIGENGIGKTTLFKIILDELDADSGLVKLGANVNIGYYDQDHKNLNDENTLFEELHNAYPRLTNTEIRNTLAAFVFKNDDALKKVANLSGGEKGRLSLAKIMLSKANLLILDEPTNHLDMFSKEILENAINAYEGTVIYISHDRYFINNTATKIFEMTSNGLNSYDGDYDYYLDKKIIEKEFKEDKTIKDSQLERQLLKEKERDIRKAKKAIEKAENRIEVLEKELEILEVELTKYSQLNNLEKIQEIYTIKTEKSEELESLFIEWDSLTSKYN